MFKFIIKNKTIKKYTIINRNTDVNKMMFLEYQRTSSTRNYIACSMNFKRGNYTFY